MPKSDALARTATREMYELKNAIGHEPFAAIVARARRLIDLDEQLAPFYFPSVKK